MGDSRAALDRPPVPEGVGPVPPVRPPAGGTLPESIILAACALLQAYVFWRAASGPLLARHVSRRCLVGAGIVLWIAFAAGRLAGQWSPEPFALMAGLCAMTWMILLFLLAVPLLALDVATGFGRLLPRLAPMLRGWALAVGAALIAIACIQGLRPPIVENQEGYLHGLPVELDGTVIAVLADLHVGRTFGKEWLEGRIDQVIAERPDLIVLLGDLFEGHGRPPAYGASILARLRAPLGVWAVAGNHEMLGDTAAVTAFLEGSGIRVLRNRWAEIRPGLLLAGVDDLGVERSRGDDLGQALEGRPRGTTILITHSPLEAERAARAGVSLMLAGHTHGGQIWPLGYGVRLFYPLLEGRYEVAGMPVIVTRGAGTWGPRMRLWRPGEILRLTLRATPKA